jgi:hypothetical protein
MCVWAAEGEALRSDGLVDRHRMPWLAGTRNAREKPLDTHRRAIGTA